MYVYMCVRVCICICFIMIFYLNRLSNENNKHWTTSLKDHLLPRFLK